MFFNHRTTDYHEHRLHTSSLVFSTLAISHSSTTVCCVLQQETTTVRNKQISHFEAKTGTPNPFTGGEKIVHHLALWVYWPFSRRCAVPFLVVLCEESGQEREQKACIETGKIPKRYVSVKTSISGSRMGCVRLGKQVAKCYNVCHEEMWWHDIPVFEIVDRELLERDEALAASTLFCSWNEKKSSKKK